MKSLLQGCNQLYKKEPCCHKGRHVCDCYECLRTDYYSNPDTYKCLKKLCCYTLNYLPSYASEIYHYLDKSKLLERDFNGSNIEILSLGCGASPEVYAIEKYIQDKKLDIEYNYTGYDNEKRWETVRENKENRTYQLRDIKSQIPLQNYDIIFLCKVFSTIKRNSSDGGSGFLNILRENIRSIKEGSYLIYVDVNHINFGRDIFNDSVKKLFSTVARYCYPIEKFFTDNYIEIESLNNVFICPNNLAIRPKPDVGKTVIFEYRK